MYSGIFFPGFSRIFYQLDVDRSEADVPVAALRTRSAHPEFPVGKTRKS